MHTQCKTSRSSPIQFPDFSLKEWFFLKHNANVLSVHNESESESVSHLVLLHSLGPHGLQPTRLLCPWNSPSKNTGVGCHFLLEGIFPTQVLNPCLLHCRQILYRCATCEVLQFALIEACTQGTNAVSLVPLPLF